jgi:hypothetical protein
METVTTDAGQTTVPIRQWSDTCPKCGSAQVRHFWRREQGLTYFPRPTIVDDGAVVFIPGDVMFCECECGFEWYQWPLDHKAEVESRT